MHCEYFKGNIHLRINYSKLFFCVTDATEKYGFLALTQEQCDQKFRHLGYFLLNQFSPKQAVSTHGLLKGFKSS
jgi:hypothetical protein